MLEQLVEELQKNIPFKENTDVGDHVIVAMEKPQPTLLYAIVTKIEADTSRKDEWWRVELLMLAFPPQKTTWTLRLPQFTGQEIFTMNGEEHFVQAVDISPPPGAVADKTEEKAGGFLRVLK